MKVFAWILLVFSSIAVLGVMANWTDDGSSLIAVTYGVAVMAFAGKYVTDAK